MAETVESSNDAVNESNENKWKVGDGSKWRVWDVIDELESSSKSRDANNSDTSVPSSFPSNDKLRKQVVAILKEWGDEWAGKSGWQTLLNKKSLMHEMEESVVALQIFNDWIEQRQTKATNNAVLPPVTLVDVCCGKGIFSMLASYFYRGKISIVSDIIMIDKQTSIDWNHISASNDKAKDDERPMIETWGGCNLHEIDQVVERLEKHTNSTNKGQLALIGIHLCKLLSPSCVGVVNALGRDNAPFLCLAPCCMPRVVLASNENKRKKKGKSEKEDLVVSVRKYETVEGRQSRYEANVRRDGAKKRKFADEPCYLCSEVGHPVRKCSRLPADETERLEIFQQASALIPCWKCGELGHIRAHCPSTQDTAKPPLTLPPTLDLDVASILRTHHDGGEDNGTRKPPFDTYCDLLSTAIQRDDIKVLDVGFVNNSAQHDNNANKDNWNRGRKSIYIVASSV